MANKSSQTKKTKPTKKVESTKVTRITASDSKSTKKPAKSKTQATKKPVIKSAKSDETKVAKNNPFVAFLGYFKGAWHELRQVRWPDRRATWSMTFALILFTAFFVLVILLLDAFFKYIFQIILG